MNRVTYISERPSLKSFVRLLTWKTSLYLRTENAQKYIAWNPTELLGITLCPTIKFNNVDAPRVWPRTNLFVLELAIWLHTNPLVLFSPYWMSKSLTIMKFHVFGVARYCGKNCSSCMKNTSVSNTIVGALKCSPYKVEFLKLYSGPTVHWKRHHTTIPAMTLIIVSETINMTLPIRNRSLEAT